LLPADEIAVRAMNLIIWGDILVGNGNDADAVPILEQALALATQAEKVYIIMIAGSSLATAHLFAGKLHEVHRVCLEALAIAEDFQSRFQNPLSATAEIYALFSRLFAEWGRTKKPLNLPAKDSC
jgi:hypothetical protein